MEETKVCPKCDKEKPLSEFGRNTSAKNGLQTYCKECCREHSRKWHAKNPEHGHKWYMEHREEQLERQRKRRMENPEQTYERSRKWYMQHRYGITLEQYDIMLETQDGGCAICGKTPEENGRRLCVDHDHETGEIRGLLCDACNRGIGALQDSINLLLIAADYLALYQEREE